MKVDYVLDAAVPVLAQESPGPPACRIHAEPLVSGPDPGGPARAARETGGRGDARGGVDAWVTAEPLENLTCRVREAFDAKEPAALAKTFARALLKYGAHEGAEKKSGPLLGWLVNLAGMATEKADTRSWLMLPAQIRAARLDLPAGRYRLRLEALDEERRVLGREEREIEVAPRQATIVEWRVFAS